MQSIMDTEPGKCFVCGKIGPTELHHVFPGSRRKRCDQDGLTVYLCPYCHWKCHNTTNGISAAEFRHPLYVKAQEKYEETHTREEFRERYGRNYLE